MGFVGILRSLCSFRRRLPWSLGLLKYDRDMETNVGTIRPPIRRTWTVLVHLPVY